jgi:hypothetical protein
LCFSRCTAVLFLLVQITQTLKCSSSAGIVRDNVVGTENYLLRMPPIGSTLFKDASQDTCASETCAGGCGNGVCRDGWCECSCGWIGDKCDVSLSIGRLSGSQGACACLCMCACASVCPCVHYCVGHHVVTHIRCSHV